MAITPLTPAQLTEQIVFTYVSAYYLGSKHTDPDMIRIRAALTLVVKAHKIPPNYIKARTTQMSAHCGQVDQKLEEKHWAKPLDPRILALPCEREMDAIQAAIIETAKRLRKSDERAIMAAYARYLEDYWLLDDEVRQAKAS